MALTAGRILTARNTQTKICSEKLIASATTLFYGGIICSDTTNKLVPAADSTAIRFEGILEPLFGPFAASLVGDGTTVYGRCTTGYEALFTCAGTVVATMRGTAIYAADDDTVTNVTTLGPQIGTLVELVTATTCWVRLNAPVMLDAT